MVQVRWSPKGLRRIVDLSPAPNSSECHLSPPPQTPGIPDRFHHRRSRHMDMLIDRWAWHVVRVVNRLDDLRNKFDSATGEGQGRAKNKGNWRIHNHKKMSSFQGTIEKNGRSWYKWVRGGLNFNPKTKPAPEKIKTNSSRQGTGAWAGIGSGTGTRTGLRVMAQWVLILPSLLHFCRLTSVIAISSCLMPVHRVFTTVW